MTSIMSAKKVQNWPKVPGTAQGGRTVRTGYTYRAFAYSTYTCTWQLRNWPISQTSRIFPNCSPNSAGEVSMRYEGELAPSAF